MKRLMLLLTTIFVTLFMCNAVFAADEEDNRAGKYITWALDDEGNLSFTGYGKMDDIVLSPSRPHPWGFDFTSVYFDDRITYIGRDVLRYCHNFTGIILPKSVKEVGQGAFWQCLNIEKLTFNEELEVIGTRSFSTFKKMTKLTLPNSVKSIGEFAFDYWIELTELTLGSSLDSIGPKAFSDCHKLKKLEVLNPIPPAMGKQVFRNTDLSGTELVVPEGSLEAYMNADQWKEFGSFRTAVKDVIADDTRIYVCADNGSIVIDGADDAVAAVYTTSGTLVYRGKENTIVVPGSGIYIVRIADRSFKIAVR